MRGVAICITPSLHGRGCPHPCTSWVYRAYLVYSMAYRQFYYWLEEKRTFTRKLRSIFARARYYPTGMMARLLQCPINSSGEGGKAK
jgi:hypothetical protein